MKGKLIMKGTATKKTNYYVNKEKRNVVCVRHVNTSPYEEIKQKCKKSLVSVLDGVGYSSLQNGYFQLPAIKGVAKCDERDEFNEETGKHLSKAIVDLKYHEKMLKEYKKMNRTIAKMFWAIDNLIKEHEEKYNEARATIDSFK